jgi:hypothetical protein
VTTHHSPLTRNENEKTPDGLLRRGFLYPCKSAAD